jgi:hypothetical protein
VPHDWKVDSVITPIIDVEGNAEGVYQIKMTPQPQVNAHFPFSGQISRQGNFQFPDQMSASILRPFQLENLSRVPRKIVVRAGDTFESLSKAFFGNTRYAEDIALYNGLMNAEHRKLRPGSILYMPRITPDRIKKDLAMPYYQFANKIVGRLNPQAGIPLPKVHHPNFFAQFVKLLAVAIVVAVAPYLAGTTLGLAGVQMFAASAVIAGIGDAAIQGVAIKLGVQEKFSVAEVIETGVSAGMVSASTAKGVEALKLSSELALQAQALNVVKIAGVQIATQLTEMAVGARDKFDAAAIGEQVAATLIALQVGDQLKSAGIDDKTGGGRVALRAANTATNAAVSGLTGRPVNLQQLASQTINGALSGEMEHYSTEQINSHSAVMNMDFEKLDIPKPGLHIPQPAYGEVSYQMGVLNQARMERERLAANTSAREAARQREMQLNEAVANMPIPSPGIPGVPTQQASDLPPSMKYDDGFGLVMRMVLPLFGNSLVGSEMASLMELRSQARVVQYGNKDEKIDALKELGKEAAIQAGVAVGVGAVGMFGRRVLRIGGIFGSVGNIEADGVLSKVGGEIDEILFDANSLKRTHNISGRASSRNVTDIADNMRNNGYSGPPIDVVKDEHGTMYIIDGHHRAAAARMTGTQVKVNVVTDISNHPSSYTTVDEVIKDSFMVGEDRLRIRR